MMGCCLLRSPQDGQFMLLATDSLINLTSTLPPINIGAWGVKGFLRQSMAQIIVLWCLARRLELALKEVYLLLRNR